MGSVKGSPLVELTVLKVLAVFGLGLGLLLLLIGAADLSPGYDDTWDESAKRAAQLSAGWIISTAGFMSMLAALVLAGVRRIVDPPGPNRLASTPGSPTSLSDAEGGQ